MIRISISSRNPGTGNGSVCSLLLRTRYCSRNLSRIDGFDEARSSETVHQSPTKPTAVSTSNTSSFERWIRTTSRALPSSPVPLSTLPMASPFLEPSRIVTRTPTPSRINSGGTAPSSTRAVSTGGPPRRSDRWRRRYRVGRRHVPVPRGIRSVRRGPTPAITHSMDVLDRTDTEIYVTRLDHINPVLRPGSEERRELGIRRFHVAEQDAICSL